MTDAPFVVGEQLRPGQLDTWVYSGLRGKPGKNKDAVRRYSKGEWIIEIRAHENRARSTRVISIRTLDQDDQHWKAERQRLGQEKTRR